MNDSSRSGSRARRRGERGARPSAMTFAVVLFMVALIVTGGGPDLSILSFAPPALLAAVVLAMALRRGALARLWALPRLTVLTILLILLLPVAQLVPLQHEWWAAMPGRALADAVLSAAGQGAVWHPLTLAVTQTIGTLVVYLWMLALLLALLVLDERGTRTVLVAVVVLAAVHLAIGALQFLSNGDRFVFYRIAHRGALIGFFANKNHSALFIVLAMLFGYALLTPAQLRDRRVQLAGAGVVLVLLVALIATLSRAGVLLGLVALAFMALLTQFERRRLNWKLLGGGLGGLAAVVLLVATSAAATRIFDRFGDVTGDVRQLFWARSWPLVAAYVPFGTGLGSFPTVFAVSERIEWLRQTFLNHVHNDYVELLIEAGLAGALLIALVAVAVARHGWRAWRQRRSPAGRWALIGLAAVVLCLLHSVVDYPLRRVALAATWTLGWALALRAADPKPVA